MGQHLEVIPRRIWLLTQGEDLPAEDTEGPNIGLGGEQAIYQALRHYKV